MVLSILISIVANIQPICTHAQFDEMVSRPNQDQQSLIASVIFDNYQEQVQRLVAKESFDQLAPSERLENRFVLANQADALFDNLLASLTVLDGGSDWKIRIMNLRRTVLLQARQVDNPWPATIWVDPLPFTDPPNEELIITIDAFLINNIDADRQERFGALKARLSGDSKTCSSIELSAMTRWGAFQQLIEQPMPDQLLYATYPLLDSGSQVRSVANWIANHVTDDSIIATIQTRFSVWDSTHNKLNNEIVKLIKKARIGHGFDPWSKGCGQPNSTTLSSIKNKLLQRSAEIQELHRSTINALLQQLTQEQRQLFEDEQ